MANEQAARTRAQQELARTKGNLAHALEATTRLENGVADASVKFGFLQEIRAYIADLCDMLQVCRLPCARCQLCSCKWRSYLNSAEGGQGSLHLCCGESVITMNTTRQRVQQGPFQVWAATVACTWVMRKAPS